MPKKRKNRMSNDIYYVVSLDSNGVTRVAEVQCESRMDLGDLEIELKGTDEFFDHSIVASFKEADVPAYRLRMKTTLEKF